MKHSIKFFIPILFMLLSTIVNATDVRGRIDTQRSPGYYQPLPKAEVKLMSSSGKKEIGKTITGLDGFYYFYNINPGVYLLVVNKSKRVRVTIEAGEAWDINPVLFR